MSGEVAYGSWFDHIQGWWKVRNDPNILILSYEELHCNFKCKIEEIAKFLGLKLPEKVFELITKESDFEKMKTNQLFSYNGVLKERGNENDLHLRRGVVGEWKTRLTQEQNQKIEKMMDTQLERSIFEKRIFNS